MRASHLLGIIGGLAALAALYIAPAHLATNPKNPVLLTTVVSSTQADHQGDHASALRRDIALKPKLARDRGADCRENEEPDMECPL